MIFFLFFIFYWLGISFRYAFIPLGIVAIFLSIYILFKKRFKLFFIGIGLFAAGIGVSYINIDINRTSFSGFVIDSHTNYFIVLSKGEKLYAYEKDNPYEIGDYLAIEGKKEKIHFISNESQFDFEEYLNKSGVYYEIDVSKITVKFSNPIRIRASREKFLSHFDENSQSLIKALLFSEKDNSEVITNIDKLHIARLSSASGIFIYAYLYFISFLLSRFMSDNKAKLISLIILSPYLIFTFPRFTILRIVFLEIFRLINKKFLNGYFHSLEIIGLSGLFFLLIDYHLGYQMSFILGFTMPFMIFSIRSATSEYKGIKKWFIQLLFVFISFIPYELSFYNSISFLNPILQALLSPLFISAAVISLVCFYGVPIYPAVDFLIRGISNILGWLVKVPLVINGPPFNGVITVFYGILFIGFCYYRNIKFIPIYRTVGIVFLSGLTLYFIPITNLITSQVSFIDVGQGDACLVRKGTKTVLIDTGGSVYKDIATETLIPYFRKHRIYNIDLVITTHGDFDHMGALDSLKENFYVKEVVTEATDFPLNVGGVTFNNYNTHIAEYSEENDQSLVVGFAMMNKNFLIMGDAPVKVEKNIIREFPDLKCDILKIGHHGSDTSTCDEFVQFLSPKEAVVSVGEKNKYGHPKQSVLNTLKRHNVIIRRTDVEGTISYSNYIFM